MKNLAKFSVEKAITVFMAVIIVMIFGVVSYTRLSTDLFPSMNIPYSVVLTTYIGASPGEVEDIVTKPFEESLATTTNIKQVTSMSQENVSIIILEFNSDANMDSAVIEMRENLDMVAAQLPDEVGNLMIIKLNPDMMPIMQFSVSQEGLTQQELTTYVDESVLPFIERIAGVASVSVSGAYESEVRVVLDETAIALINQYLVTAQASIDPTDEVEDIILDKEMISNILMAQNFEFPVGYVKVDGVNYLVRVGDEFNSVEEINDLVILDFTALPGVTDPILLGDLAEVSYVNANEKEYAKLNGENAISITVQKSSNFATTDVTNAILEELQLIEDTDGSSFTVLLNQGEYIEQATGSVTDNLLIGALLAVIVLFVFLRSARATLIVGLAIPISLMFAIVLIYLSGITLNIVSLGGLALGIGMLVDNSIVVMENIFRLKKLGKSNKEAAIMGTTQVGGAIIASTITTIAVFLPIIFIEGFIKEIFMQMALTIAYSLIASLLIALTLVPAISSRILKENSEVKGDEEKSINRIKEGYEKVFNFAFQFKAIILVLVVVLFGGSIYLALDNGFEYFPESDEGQLSISITNPVSSPLSYTEFITVLDDLGAELLAYDDVQTVGITLGSLQGMFVGVTNSDAATANVILKDNRELTTKELEKAFNTLLSTDYNNIEFDISGSQQQTAMLTGSGIQIELHGYDLDVLKTEAQTITDLLETVDGLVNIDNGIGKEAEEIKITVNKDDAIAFGITTAQVLGAVASAIASEEVITTINVEGDLYDVYVYDSNSNYSDTSLTIEEINDIVVGVNVINPSQEITVFDVAEVETITGFTTINRVDGSRAITISAEYSDEANATDVAIAVENKLNADYNLPDGYEYFIQGENEEVMDALNVLILAMALAVVLIYMIMASQFQSLSYPFIIMFTIPLAFTGGFAILWLANMTVSVVAIIGLVILIGVVVNNGIVLVDYTNQLRETGLDVKEALLEAGKTRLRPIVMTALTTILALSTMALGFGDGAEMMQPMAVTTIGGLLYATVLTLLVVPIMYFLVTKYAKQIGMYAGTVILIAGGITGIIYGFIVLGIVGIIVGTTIIPTTVLFTRRSVKDE